MDLIFCQFGVKFTRTNTHSRCGSSHVWVMLKSMAHIVGMGAPFQIIGAIIRFDVILVVYFSFLEWFWRKKTQSNDLVERIFASFIMLAKRYKNIATSRFICSRFGAHNPFRPMVSLSLFINEVRCKSFNSTKARCLIKTFIARDVFPNFNPHDDIVPFGITGLQGVN